MTHINRIMTVLTIKRNYSTRKKMYCLASKSLTAKQAKYAAAVAIAAPHTPYWGMSRKLRIKLTTAATNAVAQEFTERFLVVYTDERNWQKHWNIIEMIRIGVNTYAS